MSKKNKTGAKAASAVILFALFGVFTLLVMKVDVQPIGPLDSSVGFACLNDAVFTALGTSDLWYKITQLLGYVAMLMGVALGVVMLVQMFRRRGIFKADYRLIVLMFFYLSLAIPYVLLDRIGINYAPVLKDGALAPSYPSSHVLLIVSIMGAMPYVVPYVFHNRALVPVCWVITIVVSLITCVGRLLAGVHWLTDVIGSIILAAAWCATYDAICYAIGRRRYLRRRAARRE